MLKAIYGNVPGLSKFWWNITKWVRQLENRMTECMEPLPNCDTIKAAAKSA